MKLFLLCCCLLAGCSTAVSGSHSEVERLVDTGECRLYRYSEPLRIVYFSNCYLETR